MEHSRFFLLCFSWSFLIWDSNQLQSSQTQVLLQLRKHLEYPKQLDNWVNTENHDLCYISSPRVNITCQDNFVTEIRIIGDSQTSPSNFNGYPIPPQTLSQNFSIDSLVATLSRLNSLRVLSLVSLGIWGSIPDKIHRLQSLEYLDLSWNFLYGSIPNTISRIIQLQVFRMDGNFLNSTFPDWFDSFPNLTSLSLRNNPIYGPLPSSIEKMSSLTNINLSNMQLFGKMVDLSGLSSLGWLDLSNNRLNSQLPALPKGIIAVLLRNNSFSAKIPETYHQLNHLQQLDLSHNALQGGAPNKLFALSNITSINLGSNMLTGSIPMRLTCGRNLVFVDISNNRLRGLLPSCLSSSVKSVDFSGNCLLNNISDQHPETYCLEILQEKKKYDHVKNVGILIGVIGGIGIFLGLMAFGLLVLCRKYYPRGTSEQHLLKSSMQDNSIMGFTSVNLTNSRYISDASELSSQGTTAQRIFFMDELKAATNFFDKSTLMGEGANGKIYKGRLENGTQVAIRCLTVSKKYTMRNLKLRLGLLARLRHPNLICLLGHCIETEGHDESGVKSVHLIYEFVANGNYRGRLSGENGKMLKWSDRLGILIGISKAVHFLHTGIIPGFLSNRLKANNILLNEHNTGKLSDYGLSVVAQDIDKEEDGLKSWQTKDLEDDIYSFGIILLESLIGPSICARKESFLLNEMVSLGDSDGQKRIIDPTVLASCSQESLSIVISLTTNCISPESATRPSFEDILWNLQYAAQVQAEVNVGND